VKTVPEHFSTCMFGNNKKFMFSSGMSTYKRNLRREKKERNKRKERKEGKERKERKKRTDR
jgi:hypothetical protein